jgi:hypothetical protein
VAEHMKNGMDHKVEAEDGGQLLRNIREDELDLFNKFAVDKVCFNVFKS